MSRLQELKIQFRISCPEAGYPDCEAQYLSVREFLIARMVEEADTTDLKSVA